MSERLSPLSLASHYQPFFFLSAMHGITQPPYQGSSHYSLAILFHRLPPPLSFYLSITIMPRAYILMGKNAAERSVLGVRGLIASYLPSAVRMYHRRLSLGPFPPLASSLDEIQRFCMMISTHVTSSYP